MGNRDLIHCFALGVLICLQPMEPILGPRHNQLGARAGAAFGQHLGLNLGRVPSGPCLHCVFVAYIKQIETLYNPLALDCKTL